MSLVQTVLQVSKELSSTGFVRVVAEDNSLPHPAVGYGRWNYIVREYDPKEPKKKGKERRLTYDEFESLRIKNGVASQ